MAALPPTDCNFKSSPTLDEVFPELTLTDFEDFSKLNSDNLLQLIEELEKGRLPILLLFLDFLLELSPTF